MSDTIFPFIETVAVEEIEDDETELERFCEYAYDFENNCLLKSKEGYNYFVYENEALRIWVYKALRTSRYNYLAYTENFGSETHDLIGKPIESDIMKSEIKRYITEALMFNSYIKSVSNFVVEAIDSKILVSFDLESIYGYMNYVDELKEGGI